MAKAREGSQERVDRLERIRRERGLVNASETIRRLIDEAKVRGETGSPFSHVKLPEKGIELSGMVAELQRTLIKQALKQTGSVRGAARALKMPRKTLCSLMGRLGVALVRPEEAKIRQGAA